MPSSMRMVSGSGRNDLDSFTHILLIPFSTSHPIPQLMKEQIFSPRTTLLSCSRGHIIRHIDAFEDLPLLWSLPFH